MCVLHAAHDKRTRNNVCDSQTREREELKKKFDLCIIIMCIHLVCNECHAMQIPLLTHAHLHSCELNSIFFYFMNDVTRAHFSGTEKLFFLNENSPLFVSDTYIEAHT